MKKIHFILSCMLGLVLVTVSCNKQKTYAEYLKDENKAIEKFIEDKNFVIIDKLPADTENFKPNEFYRDPATGVYFNIIDRGIRSQIKFGEEIYVRFDGLRYFANEKSTATYSNMDTQRSPFPSTIIYRGNVSMRNTQDLYANTTPAWVVPLSYVGHTGKVKLIVPFNMGSSSDRTNYRSGSTTAYYEYVEFRFASQPDK